MTEQQANGTQTEKSTSQTLAAAREARGLSQKEVADRLYLNVTFIRHIDAGEFDRLPKPAFIKGYLRSYARAVGLSADDIVAMYDSELEASDPAPEIRDVTQEQVGAGAITGPVMQTGVIALVVFSLVIAVIWMMVAGPEEKPPVRVTQPSVTQPSEEEAARDFEFVLPSSPEPAPVSDAVVEEEQVSESAAGTDVEVTETAQQPVDQEPAPEAEDGDDVTIERTTSGSISFIKVDAGGFDQLELSFPVECWVEVEDSERGLVFSDLARQNEVLTIYGTPPFEVLLGKATGVEMLYNGRPFDLEPFIGQDSTAKVTVTE